MITNYVDNKIDKRIYEHQNLIMEFFDNIKVPFQSRVTIFYTKYAYCMLAHTVIKIKIKIHSIKHFNFLMEFFKNRKVPFQSLVLQLFTRSKIIIAC